MIKKNLLIRINKLSFAYISLMVEDFLNEISRYGYNIVHLRVRPRFFDQVGHQTTNASTGNKYFSTK